MIARCMNEGTEKDPRPGAVSFVTTEHFVQGLGGGRWQGMRTVAGMVGVITCVLLGSTIGLAVAVLFDHELALSLVAGGAAALVALAALMRFQRAAWMRAAAEPVSFEETEG